MRHDSLVTGVDVVVFDLDGTLIDSEKAICASASLAFGDLGFDVDEAAVASSPSLHSPP